MKNVKRICLYARQMQRICASIEDCAAALDPCVTEDDDPVASELLFDQLEQSQKLILALIEAIMDGAEDPEPKDSPAALTPSAVVVTDSGTGKIAFPGSNPAASTGTPYPGLTSITTAYNHAPAQEEHNPKLTTEEKANGKKH